MYYYYHYYRHLMTVKVRNSHIIIVIIVTGGGVAIVFVVAEICKIMCTGIKAVQPSSIGTNPDIFIPVAADRKHQVITEAVGIIGHLSVLYKFIAKKRQKVNTA